MGQGALHGRHGTHGSHTSAPAFFATRYLGPSFEAAERAPRFEQSANVFEKPGAKGSRSRNRVLGLAAGRRRGTCSGGGHSLQVHLLPRVAQNIAPPECAAPRRHAVCRSRLGTSEA